jgi:hypothetical protein
VETLAAGSRHHVTLIIQGPEQWLLVGESRPFHGCVGSLKHLEIAVGIPSQIARCWFREKLSWPKQ